MTDPATQGTNAPESKNSGNITKLMPSTVSLESRAVALGERVSAAQRNAREVGAELVALERDWNSASTGNFERWFNSLTGIPRSSIYYYRNIGIAVQAGLHTEQTPANRSSEHSPMVTPSANDLAAAGRALAAGQTRDVVRDSLRSGTTRDVARAAESGGLVQLEVTLTGKADATALAERMKSAYAEITQGETIAQPEALEYAHKAGITLLTQDVLVQFLRSNGEHATFATEPRLTYLETRRVILERAVRAATGILEDIAPSLESDVDLRAVTQVHRTQYRAAIDELEEHGRTYGGQA